MLNSTITHWKTTLTGASLAAFHVFAQGVNWKSLIFATLMAFFGAISKDGDK